LASWTARRRRPPRCDASPDGPRTADPAAKPRWLPGRFLFRTPCSGHEGVDGFLQRARRLRRPRRLLLRGQQLFSQLLQRLSAETLADLGEPVLLLLFHVVRDV